MGFALNVPLSEYRIAIVEDDAMQADLLASWIAEAGGLADVFSTGQDLLATESLDNYDLLLLDWMLPDILGDVVLQRLRAQRGFTGGIIFITGLSSEADISFALNGGADDYIVKPARRRELIARIEAVRRRYTNARTGVQTLDCAPYEINLIARKITLHGIECYLTAREFDLALFMFRHTEQLVRRDQLLAAVWGRRNSPETRTVDMYMSRIRRALHLHTEHSFRLLPVHSLGYRLERASELAPVRDQTPAHI